MTCAPWKVLQLIGRGELRCRRRPPMRVGADQVWEGKGRNERKMWNENRDAGKDKKSKMGRTEVKRRAREKKENRRKKIRGRKEQHEYAKGDVERMGKKRRWKR